MNVYMNKWNRKRYILVNIENNKVTLEREDGSKFEIGINEFNFAYEVIHEK